MRCLLLVCLVAAAGCDVTQDDKDFLTCTNLCMCVGGLPSSQTSCEASCEMQIGPVDDACFACVSKTTSSCATMVADCVPICGPQPMPREGDM